MERTASINRTTKETDIALTLDLDGSGSYQIETGIGFFDHMLSGFAKHGYFDLQLKATGDLYVDGHHTVEDCGIVLGKQSETKRELTDTVILYFPWMKR